MKTLREMMDLVEAAESGRSYGGGTDNAGGYSYHTTNSDGTDISVYVPGKQQAPSGYGNREYKAEPKHPLQGKVVSAAYGDDTVSGKLIGTQDQGTVAKIKDLDSGNIYYVDADTVSRNLDETSLEAVKQIDDLYNDK